MRGLLDRFDYLKAKECILTDAAKEAQDMIVTALCRVRMGFWNNNCSVMLRTRHQVITTYDVAESINEVLLQDFNDRNTVNDKHLWQDKNLVPLMMKTSLFDTANGLLLISPITDFHLQTFGSNHNKWQTNPNARVQFTMADAERNPVVRQTNLIVEECVFTAAVLQPPVMCVAGFCRLLIPDPIIAKISIQTTLDNFTVENAREAIKQISIERFKSQLDNYRNYESEVRSLRMLENNWFDTSFGAVAIATLDTRDILAFGDQTQWGNRKNLRTSFTKSEAYRL